MRWLTKEERLLLSTCLSSRLLVKSALCLMLNLDGVPVQKFPRQLVATGFYREREARVLDELGLPATKTVYEEQMLICGLGMFNWWSRIEWVPCRKRDKVSQVDRAHLDKVLHVHKKTAGPVGGHRPQGHYPRVGA